MITREEISDFIYTFYQRRLQILYRQLKSNIRF